MHLIDRYAYMSRIRFIDPAQKVALSGLVIGLCLLLDRPAVGLVAVLWMAGLAIIWAGLPAVMVGRLLLTEGLFLLLAVVGVAMSLSLVAPPASFQSIQFGPLWVSSNAESRALAALLVTRALGCAATMNLLALTTPLIDLVDLLRRLRLPIVLIDLITVMYRFVFVLLESLQRMHTAQQSRLGYATRRAALRSSGLLASRLFIDAYQRSTRMQTALESRGYAGDLRVLPLNYQHSRLVYGLGAAIAVSLLLAWYLS
ncbi:MAG: cobalt ECF transporter T component CbiQ [Chloroflexaceae bacterium]|nr:cobalt ECF transporter T component CbiQ [Chloroflexaceae bacterium]